MGADGITDIEYGTGNLRYDRVRTGVLQNKDRLTEIGYACAWTEDLDLSAPLDNSELEKRGYYNNDQYKSENFILTTFRLEKYNLPFAITIFPKSQRARIHGDNSIYGTEFDELRRELDVFEEVTGIHLGLKKISK